MKITFLEREIQVLYSPIRRYLIEVLKKINQLDFDSAHTILADINKNLSGSDLSDSEAVLSNLYIVFVNFFTVPMVWMIL